MQKNRLHRVQRDDRNVKARCWSNGNYFGGNRLQKNVPIYVTSSSKDTKGTYITGNESTINCKPIIGIAIDNNTSILTIKISY